MQGIELISTGNELLIGKTVNTHAHALAGLLGRAGFLLDRDTTIPDDADVLRSTIDEAVKRSDVVIVSGGLGPTSDDITRDVLAAMCACGLVYDAVAVEHVRMMCETYGRSFTEGRKRQALVLEGALVLKNSVGAAPGEIIEYKGKKIVLLPGPPSEFAAVVTEGVLPWLQDGYASNGIAGRKIFQVAAPESDIIERMKECRFDDKEVELAYCASERGVEVRLESVRAERLQQAAEQLKDALGNWIFSEGRQPLESVVGDKLRDARLTLATAESCTGGGVGERITSVPGASDYYVGGVVSYANRIKEDLLKVDGEMLQREGAVSEAVARQMVMGVRDLFDVDCAISITGIAGPDGGTAEKPVGLAYIGVICGEKVRVEKFLLGPGRGRVRLLASQMALNMLRLLLDEPV